MSKPRPKITKKVIAEAIKQVAKISAEVDKKIAATSREMKEMVKLG